LIYNILKIQFTLNLKTGEFSPTFECKLINIGPNFTLDWNVIT